MSEQTFNEIQIEEQPSQPRATRPRGPHRKRQAWPFLELNLDVPLLLAVFTLLIFGALMVYSASADFSLVNYGDPTYMFFRQLMNIGIALATARCGPSPPRRPAASGSPWPPHWSRRRSITTSIVNMPWP